MTEKELAACLMQLVPWLILAFFIVCLVIAMVVKHRKDEKEWNEFIKSNPGSDEGEE